MIINRILLHEFLIILREEFYIKAVYFKSGILH